MFARCLQCHGLMQVFYNNFRTDWVTMWLNDCQGLVCHWMHNNLFRIIAENESASRAHLYINKINWHVQQSLSYRALFTVTHCTLIIKLHFKPFNTPYSIYLSSYSLICHALYLSKQRIPICLSMPEKQQRASLILHHYRTFWRPIRTIIQSFKYIKILFNSSSYFFQCKLSIILIFSSFKAIENLAR